MYESKCPYLVASSLGRFLLTVLFGGTGTGAPLPDSNETDRNLVFKNLRPGPSR